MPRLVFVRGQVVVVEVHHPPLPAHAAHGRREAQESVRRGVSHPVHVAEHLPYARYGSAAGESPAGGLRQSQHLVLFLLGGHEVRGPDDGGLGGYSRWPMRVLWH